MELGLSSLVSLGSRPQAWAAAAVEGATQAGVKVAMITGDHKQTANAIASQLGILNRKEC